MHCEQEDEVALRPAGGQGQHGEIDGVDGQQHLLERGPRAYAAGASATALPPHVRHLAAQAHGEVSQAAPEDLAYRHAQLPGCHPGCRQDQQHDRQSDELQSTETLFQARVLSTGQARAPGPGGAGAAFVQWGAMGLPGALWAQLSLIRSQSSRRPFGSVPLRTWGHAGRSTTGSTRMPGPARRGRAARSRLSGPGANPRSTTVWPRSHARRRRGSRPAAPAGGPASGPGGW